MPTTLRYKFKLLDLAIIAFVICAAVFFLYRIRTELHYTWHWEKIPQFLFRKDAQSGDYVSGILMLGLYNTLRLSFFGVLLATFLGTVMGICKSSRILFFRLISGAYVGFMRNLPPLVIIYIFYFFIGDQILPLLHLDSFLEARSGPVRQVAEFFFATPAYINAFMSALLTLAVFEGAYITEIIRSGIESIDHGQWEAARALGLTRWQQMRHIVLPQAFQRVLPPLAGQFISLIKDSAIVSVISIQELTFQATELMTSTLLTMEIWITVTLLYLVLTLPSSLLVSMLEKRMARAAT